MDYKKRYIDLCNAISFVIYIIKKEYDADEVVAVLEKALFDSMNLLEEPLLK